MRGHICYQHGMPAAWRVSIFGVILLVLGSCDRDGPHRETSAGPSRIVVADAEPPCQILIIPTGVTLAARSDGEPLPVHFVARDSRGRFYTQTYNYYEVGVWMPDGRYSHTLGSQGGGPGEFESRAAETHIGLADTLYVRSGSVWSVFDPSGNFIRYLQSDPGLHPYVHFLSNGTILSTEALSESPILYRVFDANGDVIRRFGEVNDEDRASGVALLRPSGYGGGNTFWVSVRQGTTLEEWSVEGEHIRTVYRDAGWFNVSPAVERARIRRVAVDDFGFLWISGDVRPVSGPAPERNNPRIEVIDPDNGVLVATTVLDVLRDASVMPVPQLFPASREAYWAKLDEQLNPIVEIVRYELYPRKGSNRMTDVYCPS